MPPLPRGFSQILEVEPLPLSAVGADVLERFSAAEMRVLARGAHNLFGDGMGPVFIDLGVRRAEVPDLLTAGALAGHAGFARVASGQAVLRAGESDLLRLVQQALQAVAARAPGAPPELRLAGWGADGGFGDETRLALAALRGWLGIGGGQADEFTAADAGKLVEVLRAQPVPDLWLRLPVGASSERSPRRVVDIAAGICAATAQVPYVRRVDGRLYSYTAAHFGVAGVEDGLLRAPGGVAYRLRTTDAGFWKCNIFGGTVLALAELPVPTFPVGKHRHFPRAERFGERLALKPGWRLVHYLDHRDPSDPRRSVAGAEQDREIAELLAAAQPGDLLFVDHPGEPGDEGGHVRVCTAAAEPGNRDVAPLWAQATAEMAMEVREGTYDLGGGAECQLWLLRYRGR